MATNDGFSPYPIGLTAAQSVAAILAAHNLSSTLGGYVKFTSDTDANIPLVGVTKTGDIFESTDTGKTYRGWVDGATLIWFEV